MPPEAKIFYVEDDNSSRKVITEYLNDDGHTVVEIATNLEDALDKIPDLKIRGVNVAIVDGNLSRYSQDGSDGKLVIQEIKKQHPDIIVIGHSLEKPLFGADYNSTKLEGADNLVQIVRNA